jgi:lysozyme
MIDRGRLRAQLAKHEDKRQFVYDDATGKPIGEGTFVRGLPTVGIGRNLYGKGLSEDEIEYLADNDIADALADAHKFKWFDGLDPVRQNAVTELLFNLGLKRFSGFVKFINFMNEGRWVHAAGELKNSKWYTQVKGRGDTIANMVLTGEWPNE